jgi:hypothetical protein
MQFSRPSHMMQLEYSMGELHHIFMTCLFKSQGFGK